MNKEFLVPLSIVFTLLGAAVSYGVTYNKVDNVEALIALEREDRKEADNELKKEQERTNELLTQLLLENGIEVSAVETDGYISISTTLISE